MNEAIVYDITIQKKGDYHIDFLTEEDDGTPIDVSGYTVESHLREFPESNEYLEFTGIADETGIHLDMAHSDTAKIGYTRGYYDVFVSENGNREKFAMGRARIIPEVTR